MIVYHVSHVYLKVCTQSVVIYSLLSEFLLSYIYLFNKYTQKSGQLPSHI